MKKQPRFGWFAVTLILSILWTAYQMAAFEAQFSYSPYAKVICQLLNLPMAGTETSRMCSVLAYLQSLPHILLAYCLLVKWPPKNSAEFSFRAAAVAFVFLVTAIAIPRVGPNLIPSLQGSISRANETYMKILMTCFLSGLAGVVLVFFISCTRESRKSGLSGGIFRYILVVVLAFLMAVLYGFALGVLAHFNHSAANAVVRNFTPDTNLYSGLFTMGVMAPLVEELGYRGLILTKLKKYLPLSAAVLVSSVLFAVWHRNLGQIVATFPMGILFACIYLRTGKLRYSMLLHSLSNTLMTLSMASPGALVPYIEALPRLRRQLLDIPLGYGLLGIVILSAAIALILWKGFGKPANADEYIKKA